MEIKQLKNILEAAILATNSPVSINNMVRLFRQDKQAPTRDEIKAALECLAEDCAERGVELKQIASGYQFQSKVDFSQWLQHLWEEKPQRYTRALIETLALIAYRQPITRGEIEEVRGVAVSTNIIKTLLEREWVKVAGHKEVPGRPALYGTTKQFLDYFNLKTLRELPTLDEVRDIEEIGKQLNLEIDGEEASAANDAPSDEELPVSDPDEIIIPNIEEEEPEPAENEPAEAAENPE